MELADLFPESPHAPELVRLVFANGDPDDYQSTIEVSADDFPVYSAAPALLAALRDLFTTAPGAWARARAAIAAAEGRA